jgi:hypothetical protein
MNVSPAFCTEEEAAALLALFPASTLRMRSQFHCDAFPFVRWSLNDAMGDEWSDRAAAATGLPRDGLTGPVHRNPHIVLYRPADIRAKRTAFDLDDPVGRATCVAYNRGTQRYAEANLLLDAPGKSASADVGDAKVRLAVGDLVWWEAAGPDDKPRADADFRMPPTQAWLC